MKALIAGAGAVGGILGGALMRNGHEAVFLARSANLAALRDRGLQIFWPDETWSWPGVRTISADSPQESFDVALFCVKGYDWQRTADTLSRFPSACILTFQNGVSVHHEMAKRTNIPVFGSVIYVPADRPEPGVVVSKGPARVVLDGSSEAAKLTAPLSEALAVNELKTQLSEKIELDLWRKYLFICSFSAINTLTEKPCSVLLQESDMKDLWARMMREIALVGRACGIQIGDPDVEHALSAASRFPADTNSSLLADTLRKQKTELDLLQGYLVKLAKKLSVDIPVSRILYSLLKAKTRV